MFSANALRLDKTVLLACDTRNCKDAITTPGLQADFNRLKTSRAIFGKELCPLSTEKGIYIEDICFVFSVRD